MNKRIFKRIRSSAIPVMLAASLVYGTSPSVYIHFHDSVTINSAAITLGDISIVDCPASKGLCEQLNEMKVGSAAPAGFARYLSVYDVLHYVVAPYLNKLDVKTNGVKRVKIRTRARVRSVMDYSSEIKQYVADNVKWNRDDYSLTIKNGEREFRCYDRPFTVGIEGLSSPYPKGTIRLKLKVVQDSAGISVPVVCRVTVETPVVCVTEPIGRNRVITKDLLGLHRKDITAYRYTPFTKVSSVTNKIAAKTLTPGTIIHERCLKSLPAVTKGDIVYITLEKGPVRVSVQARARENGSIGEKIWVENIQSHKLIQVKVAAKGIVHVNTGDAI